MSSLAPFALDPTTQPPRRTGVSVTTDNTVQSGTAGFLAGFGSWYSGSGSGPRTAYFT